MKGDLNLKQTNNHPIPCSPEAAGLSAVSGCKDGSGILPGCAPLASPYVPFQPQAPDRYQANLALIRGTLYPGLDLPLLGMVNTQEKSGTALHRLQALHFALSELGLYLDTHVEDTEAAELYNQYAEQYQDCLQQYQKDGGVLAQMDAAQSGRWQWLNDPWPWDAETEG